MSDFYNCYSVTFYDCTAPKWKKARAAIAYDLDNALLIARDEMRRINRADAFTPQESGEVLTADEVTDNLEDRFLRETEYAETDILSADGVPPFMVSIERVPFGEFFTVTD